MGAPRPRGTGRTLVVIPALNEERSVGEVIREIHATTPDADVLVVDDGSTDATVAVATEAGAWVLRMLYHLGVGGAMRGGFRFANRHGYAAVVQVDADGQHDPAEIGRLLAGLEHDDVVVGARFAGRGEYAISTPRRWAMRVLALAVGRLVGTSLDDVTSGFRAAGPRAIRVFAVDYPVEYLGDTLESLGIASQAGLRVSQVPVMMRPRADGDSSQSPIWATVYFLRALLVLALAGIRPSAPEHRRST